MNNQENKLIGEDDYKNVIKIEMSRQLDVLLRQLSDTLELPISHILREILRTYKDKSVVTNKTDTEDYSKLLYVRCKDNVTIEDYSDYANKISNYDIASILNELYDIKII